jgi:hypothetical protein
MEALKKWFHSVEWRHGFHNIGALLTQAANVILGNPFSKNTWPDESICARAGRMKKEGEYTKRRKAINWVWEHIFRQGPNHCENAWAKEQAKYQQHPDSRK